MATYSWRENFIAEREITVEADSMEEAQAKAESGDWSSEHTIDFYSYEKVSDIKLDE